MVTHHIEKYKCIVADPPWSFRNKRTGGSMTSGAADKYAVMELVDIKLLDVNGISVQELGDKDSILFLWVPNAMLPEGLEVMKAWGYTYKTKLTWIKDKKNGKLGIGYWFRNTDEPCLIGIRGKVKAFRSSSKNIIYEEPREHSRKPDGFFKLIEPELKKFDLNPKIELFAREHRDGWIGWGDEL